ncbi:glycosyltransferase involved in cell wall biosynthesis [Spinactinospora alkalitolerans]|uniref:Glycosyltransferase involved in cell wall biosynthesis n=1 Tax=Spinactinospora alkalitolerans TaxID=687207 RepID=A0A852TYF9_9ACTN|nr:glycosyltransferase family 4 protein [Spinactinospora alkalitolerans]NYE47034.1 glycosyltransferase involved in cell wall biosynthesis [Spinactinospora alkalitolerans]
MRVLRLCSVFEVPPGVLEGRGRRFDPVGGMQNHTARLSEELDRLGVAQTVLTTRPPGAPTREPLGSRGQVVRLGLPVPWARQMYSLPAAGRVHRLAADADLVHAHLGEDIAVVPLALLAVSRRRLPLVLTVHCSVLHTVTADGPRSAMLKLLGGRMEALGLARADAVIVLTPRTRRLVRGLGVAREKVSVISSGVAEPAFAGGTSGPDPLAGVPRPRVLFLGRLHRQKGVDVLLRAFSRIADQGAHLVVVGDGPEAAGLRALADRLGVAARVHWRGFVPHEQVPPILAAVDALALPSRYEELGTVLVEALRAGVPVVAADTGGIPDVIEDGVTGLLVPAEAPEPLARALSGLLGDRDLAARLAAAGRARAARYRWDRLARQVLSLYADLVLPARVEPV